MPRRPKIVYPSDLSDAQWEVVAPVLHRAVGRVGQVPRREILNAIFYVMRTGCRVPSGCAVFAPELPQMEDGL